MMSDVQEFMECSVLAVVDTNAVQSSKVNVSYFKGFIKDSRYAAEIKRVDFPVQVREVICAMHT